MKFQDRAGIMPVTRHEWRVSTLENGEYRMISRFYLLALAVAMAAPVAADSLDINLHDDALRVTYATGSFHEGLDLDLGYLYAKKRGQTGHVAHVGLQVAGQNWSDQGEFDVGLGGRLVYTDTRSGDGANLALGGTVRFSPIHLVGFNASLFYAPNITSFMDSERYKEWGVSVDYQLLARGFVYLGYRNVESRIKNRGTHEIDDSLHLGMKLLF
jgi:hypothetical protein